MASFLNVTVFLAKRSWLSSRRPRTVSSSSRKSGPPAWRARSPPPSSFFEAVLEELFSRRSRSHRPSAGFRTGSAGRSPSSGKILSVTKHPAQSARTRPSYAPAVASYSWTFLEVSISACWNEGRLSGFPNTACLLLHLSAASSVRGPFAQ